MISSVNAFKQTMLHLSSKLRRHNWGTSKTFALLESVTTFMCYPYREDNEVDSLDQKLQRCLYRLTSIWSPGLELSPGKIPKHEEMCYLFECIIQLNLSMSVCRFPDEDYWVQMLFQHVWWSFGCLATSSYCPDCATMADSMQCKSSQ